MQDCKINILGTEYDLAIGCKEPDADGLSKVYSKKIFVRPSEEMLDASATPEEKLLRQKEVIRHEIYHCALYEGTGMHYVYDENLVDFLAVNAPKIFKIFYDLNIL